MAASTRSGDQIRCKRLVGVAAFVLPKPEAEARRPRPLGRRRSTVDSETAAAPGRVYSVCMARVNVYLPDDLAESVKLAGVSISAITQDALRSALAALDTDAWLDGLELLVSRADIEHERVLAAIDEAREDFGARPQS